MAQNVVLSIVRYALVFQSLALGFSALRAGSVIGSFLYIGLNIPEPVAMMAENLAGIALIFASFLLMLNWSLPGLLILGFTTLSMTISRFLFGGSFMSELVFLTEAVRYGFPLLLWKYFCSGNGQTFPSVNRLLSLLVAATFIGHGIKAMYHNPQFTDYLITIFTNTGIYHLSETQAGILLYVIGVFDILAGLAILWGQRLSEPVKWSLRYMVLWGLLTAVVRVLYNPALPGLEQCLLRMAHCAAPLLLLHLLQHQPAHTLKSAQRIKPGGFINLPIPKRGLYDA